MGGRKQTARRKPGPRPGTKRTRSTPRRPPGEREPLTVAQDNRYSLMRRNGVTQQSIADHLAAKRIEVARQTVGAVILNKFVNDDIIDAFCELTKTSRADAWPDVPSVEA